MHDKKSSMVTTRKAYELIVSEHLLLSLDGILTQVWNFNIPQKLKCFTWMAFNKKINTCDNLCKRGCLGPNRCFLCKIEAETIDHIFVECPSHKR